MYDRGLWRYIRFFENPVDFINSPVYRDGCEFSGIFPENPVGLAGMYFLLVGWSTRNIGKQLQSSVTTKRKLEVHLLKSDHKEKAGRIIPETQFI